MIRFAPLNKQDSVSTPVGKHGKPTKEAQESAVLQLYHAAMKEQQKGKLDEARQLYCEILQSDIIHRLTPSSGSGGSTLHKVKFLILKNLANIAKEKGDTPAAISAYLEASAFDNKDTTLCYQLALACTSLGELVIARKALEQVLHINSQYWPAITLLCSVLLAIEDYYACLQVSVAALEMDPQFSIGVGLIQHLLTLCPEFLMTDPLLRIHLIQQKSCDIDKILADAKELQVKYQVLKNVTVLPESIVPPVKLNNISLESLGKFLISIYHHCKEVARKSHKLSLTVSVDLYTVLDGVNEELVSLPSPVKKPVSQAQIISKSSKELPLSSDNERRKRRSQSDSEGPFVPKRRSTRVRAKEKEHQDYFQLIKRYIPPLLRFTEMPDISDLASVTTPSSNRKEPVLDMAIEIMNDNDTVRQFIQSHQVNSGIINLLSDFLWILATHYNFKWSSSGYKMAKIFTDCYELVHKHLNHPSPFSAINELSDGEKSYTRQLLLMGLCYTELMIDSLYSTQSIPKRAVVSNTQLSSCFTQCLVFIQYIPLCVLETENERLTTALRVDWLRGKWCSLQKQNEAAMITLERCKHLLDTCVNEEEVMESHDFSHDSLIIHLPNCSVDNVISIQHVTDKIKSVEETLSKTNVHQFFKEHKYDDVINILLPILDQESGSYSEFFLGYEENQDGSTNLPGIQLLMESLIETNRMKECLQYTVHSLIEILIYYSTQGPSDRWIDALTYTCLTTERCFEKDPELLSNCIHKIIQDLIICLIKILDIAQDLYDSSYFLNLPIILSWTLLYTIFSCVTHVSDIEPMEIGIPVVSNEKTESISVPQVENSQVSIDDSKKLSEGIDSVQSVTVSEKSISIVSTSETISTSMIVSVSEEPMPVDSTSEKQVDLPSTSEKQTLSEKPLESTSDKPIESMETSIEFTDINTSSSNTRIELSTNLQASTTPEVSVTQTTTLNTSTEPVIKDTVVSLSTTFVQNSIVSSNSLLSSAMNLDFPSSPETPISHLQTTSQDVPTSVSPPTNMSQVMQQPTCTSVQDSPLTSPPPHVTQAPSQDVSLPSQIPHLPVSLSESPTNLHSLVTPQSREDILTSSENMLPTSIDNTPSQISPSQVTHSLSHDHTYFQLPSNTLESGNVPLPSPSRQLSSTDMPQPQSETLLPPANPSSSRDSTKSPSTEASSGASKSISPEIEWKNQKECSLNFLQLAHSQLGSMSVCTRDEGHFLQSIVSTLRQELRGLTTLPTDLREILLKELEQCYYCLHGYPYKKAKSRKLVDHNVDQIPMTWNDALMLVEYYRPTYLPSIDDTKSPQVTSELITLYKKISEVVPEEGQVLSVQSIIRYIEGSCDDLPTPSSPKQHSSLMSEIYYLLADDCLKSLDNNKAIKYYHLNLSYCPDGFDSWAGLALARSNRITDKLNQRDSRLTVETFVQKNTLPAVRCFKKALSFNKKHCYVVEKFGFFSYAIHSFASQIKKLPLLYKSKETQRWAETAVKNMLILAELQFQQALSLEGSRHSEPWIYHFMLAKISYKLKKPASVILEHFVKSSEILHRDGAAYPIVIEVTSKGYAIEALEVHYQFLSTMLKLLLSSEDKQMFSSMSQAVSSIRYLPLGCITHESLWNWATHIVDIYQTQKQAPVSESSECPMEVESTPLLKPLEYNSSRPTIVNPLLSTSNVSSACTTTQSPSILKLPTVPVTISHSNTTQSPSILKPQTAPVAISHDTITQSPSILKPQLEANTIPHSVALMQTGSSLPSISTNNTLQNIGSVSSTTVVSAFTSQSPTVYSVSTTAQISSETNTNLFPRSSVSTQILAPHISTLPNPLYSTPISTPVISDNITKSSHASPVVTSQLSQRTESHDTLGSRGILSTPLHFVDEEEEDEEEVIVVDDNTLEATSDIGVQSVSSNDETHCMSAVEFLAHEALNMSDSNHSHEDMMSRFSVADPDPLIESLYGVAMCTAKFPAYFKPLYRLASTLNEMGLPEEAKKFLLGPLPECFTELQDKLVPIFVLKTNIYQNMWQIQVNEINRPGNFSTHARLCLELLLDILTALSDLTSLIFIAQQLKTKVDPSKQYMRETERPTVYVKALKCCIDVLKTNVSTIYEEESTDHERYLLEAYSLRNMMLRIETFKDKSVKDVEECMMKLFSSIWKNEKVQELIGEEGIQSPIIDITLCLKYCQMKSTK